MTNLMASRLLPGLLLVLTLMACHPAPTPSTQKQIGDDPRPNQANSRRLWFVEGGGERIDLIANCSYPEPRIALDDAQSNVVIDARTHTALITIGGTVEDCLADITEKHQADITSVRVTFTSQFADKIVPVRRAPAAPTALAPFRFLGQIDKTTVRLQLQGVEEDFDCVVHATNALGADGMAGFILHTTTADKVTLAKDAPSEPGLWKPVRVRVFDPSVTPKDLPGLTGHFFGHAFHLQPTGEKGVYEFDRPFIAVTGKLNFDASNIINVLTFSENPTVASYKDVRDDLSWAFTAH